MKYSYGFIIRSGLRRPDSLSGRVSDTQRSAKGIERKRALAYSGLNHCVYLGVYAMPIEKA